jgi:hypothetical protein
VRIWSVVRSGADVLGGFQTQLYGSVTGLAANWKFDESEGTTATDSQHSQTATLTGGATFSTDVHP